MDTPYDVDGELAGPFGDDDPEDRYDDGDPVAVRVETLVEAVAQIVDEDPNTPRHHARHAGARLLIDGLLVARTEYAGELAQLRDDLNAVPT
jgi:hypothetical protein